MDRVGPSLASSWEPPDSHDEWGELVAYDPIRKQWIYHKREWRDGQEVDVWKKLQDVQATLEENQRLYNESAGTKFGDWARIASVPTNVLYGTDLNRAHNEGDTKWVNRWLNDPDNRKFRTRPGRV